MEARIKSSDSTRSLAQLVWAKRIYTIYCLNLSYALFMKIYSYLATVPAGGLLQGKCVTLPRISYAYPTDAWFEIIGFTTFHD